MNALYIFENGQLIHELLKFEPERKLIIRHFEDELMVVNIDLEGDNLLIEVEYNV